MTSIMPAIVPMLVFLASSSRRAKRRRSWVLPSSRRLEDVRGRLEADLAAARSRCARARRRRCAHLGGTAPRYLGRYREAIAEFSEGTARFPPMRASFATVATATSPCASSIRQWPTSSGRRPYGGCPDQIEPDGQPNARNIPLTTLQSNIRHHLALAYYLKGDFARAAVVWGQARDAVKNPDNLVSTTHWLCTSRYGGSVAMRTRPAREAVTPGLEVIENGSYHRCAALSRRPHDR